MLDLYPHQRAAVEKLKPGSILVGGVGSGKTITSLVYFYEKICGGSVLGKDKDYSPMRIKKDLYVITTARKRDTLDWEADCSNVLGLKITKVDSWNNVEKYTTISDAFFIFDEQRVIGSGQWVKSFLKITKKNQWILLSATPADTWMDYIPVFIANGFYKNRTEFISRHVVYSRFSKFPRVDHYVEVARLIRLRDSLLIPMHFERHTEQHHIYVNCEFDKDKQQRLWKDRWNIYENKPVTDISQLCFLLRQLVNSDDSRQWQLYQILQKHPKIIIFYNFNYELDILRRFASFEEIPYAEWNGHKHEPIPEGTSWIYLVQYTAGAEGWNAIETDTVLFYSHNYSYKIMIQAAGRIDRLNTPFTDLYYYHLTSRSIIDTLIKKALANKQAFNERQLSV